MQNNIYCYTYPDLWCCCAVLAISSDQYQRQLVDSDPLQYHKDIMNKTAHQVRGVISICHDLLCSNMFRCALLFLCRYGTLLNCCCGVTPLYDIFVCAMQALLLVAAAKEELPRITLPFKCVHGADDTIALPVGSRLLHSLGGTSDDLKSVEVLPGLRHEVRMSRWRDDAPRCHFYYP